MIKSVRIERFKSVRHLELDCQRINLFIGEPNTGKSNLLEALGLLSWLGWPYDDLQRFVRFQFTHQLFHDGLTEEPICIRCRGTPDVETLIRFEEAAYLVQVAGQVVCRLDPHGQGRRPEPIPDLSAVRFYRYDAAPRPGRAEPGILIPPHGPNLFSVVYGSKALREWVAELFRPYGLAVVFKPHEQAVELQKLKDGVAISYPLGVASDTLRRVLFYKVAMSSNQPGVLVFEEPEAHAFPYYTKHLGEQIAEDPLHQYFIATHNPYLLAAVIEKAPQQDVSVFVTRYVNHETLTTRLNEGQISRLLEADPFLDLESVLETP
ncbi:AAA family ATPase [Limisphaera ngatamarikiensis]|uniref:AAA family ATPase n=1 Tax=Limisphaera ngatamarikiensis TaxID=1324935 RepID=A0A6M1RSR2_9BACT|nr:AAA family ATPase [Limisphaera ngatamarikiensis]NGO38391.1 AAA family ATPase [Limisphaera ngatamarikiensis]